MGANVLKYSLTSITHRKWNVICTHAITIKQTQDRKLIGTEKFFCKWIYERSPYWSYIEVLILKSSVGNETTLQLLRQSSVRSNIPNICGRQTRRNGKYKQKPHSCVKLPITTIKTFYFILLRSVSVQGTIKWCTSVFLLVSTED